jgi:hypothetical protein
MPINDPKAINDALQRAFANGWFSPFESASILRKLKQDGISDEEAKTVVEAFSAAMRSGSGVAQLKVDSSARRAVVNKFLAKVDPPVDKAHAPKLPNGAIDFVTLLTRPAMAIGRTLPAPALSGKSVGVEANGDLVLDGNHVALALAAPDGACVDALWALNLPGQLDALDAGARCALAEKLAAALGDGAALAADAPNKFDRMASLTAAAGALSQCATSWTPAVVDAALEVTPKVTSPLGKALLLRGLAAATLTAAQTRARDRLAAPEGAAELLERYDALRAQTQPINGAPATGVLAQVALSALSSGRTAAALDSLASAFGAWASLNGEPTSFDADELEQLAARVKSYVDTSDSVLFLFGLFAESAGKDVASVRTARLVAQLSVKLKAEPPSLSGYPLTRHQADVLLSVLDKARDEGAVANLKRCMNLTAAAFRAHIEEGNTADAPAQPIGDAAFDFLERSLRSYTRQAESSSDGKLGFDDLAAALERDAGELSSALGAKLAALGATPPCWDDVTLSAEAAGFLRGVLGNNLRSLMSIDNLDRAVRVIAAANGGALVGAAAADLSGVITDYVALWPGRSYFDFNKLERLAKCKVAHQPYPTFTVNGAPATLANFYESVGQAVATSLDRSSLTFPWMADRWAMRARSTIEILDVVAEQAARGEGPVALLRGRYPGKGIEVAVTGRDGDHEQFIYTVKDGDKVVDYFTQGSDGTVASYHKVTTPVVMRARIDEQGGLQVKIEQPLSLKRYPLAQTYGVGDSIDYPFFDSSATESETEHAQFSTRYKILEAKITGFSADGTYNLEYAAPDGTARTAQMDLAAIRKANNPHYFPLVGSEYSDVSINVDKDKVLRDFVEGAKPIIARFLPSDGSLIGLTPSELAERQRDCVAALQAYTTERMKYPTEKEENPDELSKKYWDLSARASSLAPVPFGQLLDIKRGVCRHQCIAAHLLCQIAGIDSRLASGAANEGDNDFRGYHIWQELTLADGQRYLSDQTWSDVAVPLWHGAYDADARRKEMSNRTAQYDDEIVNRE